MTTQFASATVLVATLFLGTQPPNLEQRSRPDRVRPDDTPEVQPQLRPQERGLAITEVIPNGPAERAGLEPGDIILSVDGARVQSLRELSDALREAQGRARLLVIDRRTGRRTPIDVQPRENGRIGIYARAVEVPAEQEGRGVAILITRVWSSSPAANAGLESGDMILQVDGKKVESLGDFSRTLQASTGSVRLKVYDQRTRSETALYVEPDSRRKIGISGETVPWPGRWEREPSPY